jgi:hypothetical protein
LTKWYTVQVFNKKGVDTLRDIPATEYVELFKAGKVGSVVQIFDKVETEKTKAIKRVKQK